MSLLEEYLKNTGKLLPASMRQDVLRELRGNLQAQFDDHAAEMGRALTEAEQKRLLRAHGDPVKVAAAYRQDTRMLALGAVLVGPSLFPIYQWVLAINVGCTILASTTVGLIMQHYYARPMAWSSVGFHALLNAAIVTVLFAVAERYSDKKACSGTAS